MRPSRKGSTPWCNGACICLRTGSRVGGRNYSFGRLQLLCNRQCRFDYLQRYSALFTCRATERFSKPFVICWKYKYMPTLVYTNIILWKPQPKWTTAKSEILLHNLRQIMLLKWVQSISMRFMTRQVRCPLSWAENEFDKKAKPSFEGISGKPQKQIYNKNGEHNG